eukprot:7456-Heterococcus_DN1.PRE.1
MPVPGSNRVGSTLCLKRPHVMNPLGNGWVSSEGLLSDHVKESCPTALISHVCTVAAALIFLLSVASAHRTPR